ncbi:MAG TPA: FliH/SctL family protein [Polyangiales bacterium]|nr:FliH/SctL family protein [Polyangiales bacterium]
MARVIRAERQGPAWLPAAVHEAREHASQIVARAEDEARVLRERAYAEGSEQGRAQAASALFDVAELRRRSVDQAESSAVEAIVLITKRLIGEAFATDRTRIVELVSSLLARVRRARQLIVHVHPADAATLRDSLDQPWLRRLALEGTLEVRDDASLERGGVRIESNLGELDARVDTRLHELTRALRREPRDER